MTADTVILLALLLALQVADGRTTYLLLSRGGRELNPVVRWAINRCGLVPGLLLAKGAVALSVVGCTLAGQIPVWSLLALCALYLVVVVRNFGQLFKEA